VSKKHSPAIEPQAAILVVQPASIQEGLKLATIKRPDVDFVAIPDCRQVDAV